MLFKGVRSSAAVALLVLVAGFAIAACGSSSSSSSVGASASGGSSTTSTSTSTTRGGFASLTSSQRTCLKSHGMTLPSGNAFRGGNAPTGTSTTGAYGHFGGGLFGGANSSKFAAAFKACGISFPSGGNGAGSGAGRASVSASAVKQFVACVNQHGYKLTGVNTSGTGSVLPARLRTNKKFLAAAKSCTSLLNSGASSTTPTTASST